METNDMKKKQRFGVLSVILCVISLLITAYLLADLFFNDRDPSRTRQGTMDYALMERYEMAMANEMADALSSSRSGKKTYWLMDSDLVAPEPDQNCYGETDDPAGMQWLLDEAAELLNGQSTYFSTATQIIPGTKVRYYLDETILAIAWKEEIDGMCYTIAEVKIAHPSQFRRFLAGGEYGSAIELTTSEMAASANAVVASAGDFYKYRQAGVIVYDRQMQRTEGCTILDTCFVDENGDLILRHMDELSIDAEVKAFVEENKVRFSLAFGPILIRNGQRCDPVYYSVGEIYEQYSRAGLGQLDDLHYVLTSVNYEFFDSVPDIFQFAAGAEKIGCKQFYALDGGQTATIVMNDQVVNAVDYGNQRNISDIVYFATALPKGG